jgi:type IV secretory pathway VirB3-like protein
VKLFKDERWSVAGFGSVVTGEVLVWPYSSWYACVVHLVHVDESVFLRGLSSILRVSRACLPRGNHIINLILGSWNACANSPHIIKVEKEKNMTLYDMIVLSYTIVYIHQLASYPRCIYLYIYLDDDLIKDHVLLQTYIFT